MHLEEGAKAPEFSLLDHNSETCKLAQYSGKRTVLYFYPKDDTPGCTTEALDFTQLLPQFEELGAVILGVSPDSPEKHTKFIEKYNLGIRLLSDPDKQCIEAYGAWGEKMNYGKTYIGLIRSTIIIGPDGMVEKCFYNVKAKGHAERILKYLQENN